uniref:NIDO domain-containing protein n=1 Tax=Astyanax mexicanus TaxID=7994 RepID=A0A8B9J5Y3_ASTMX
MRTVNGCFGIKYFILNLLNFPTASSPPLFYPFGTGAGDTVCPQVDDTNSSVINLTSPFFFFGRSYPQIYINHNGFLTFDQASSSFTPIQFNSSYSGRDIIAPFWTDIDNSLNGIISYNLYTVGNVLSRATQDINQYFTGVSLSVLWVFVATWDKVAYFQNSGTVRCPEL